MLSCRQFIRRVLRIADLNTRNWHLECEVLLHPAGTNMKNCITNYVLNYLLTYSMEQSPS